MIRPLENQERLHPVEYVNRVKQPEATPSSAPRDFSYQIEEASREGKHRQSPGREFGEDSYEPTEEETPTEKKPAVSPAEPSAPPDDGTLDIVV